MKLSTLILFIFSLFTATQPCFAVYLTGTKAEQQLLRVKAGVFAHALKKHREQSPELKNAPFTLDLTITPAGIKRLNPEVIADHKTGIEKLDALNKAQHSYPITFDSINRIMTIAFQKKPAEIMYTIEGGKYWRVHNKSEKQSSNIVKQIWIQLNAEGSKQFEAYKKSARYNPDQTGIKMIDELNKKLDARICDIFYANHNEIIITLLFNHPVDESVLDLYGYMDEVEKSEKDDELMQQLRD